MIHKSAEKISRAEFARSFEVGAEYELYIGRHTIPCNGSYRRLVAKQARALMFKVSDGRNSWLRFEKGDECYRGEHDVLIIVSTDGISCRYVRRDDGRTAVTSADGSIERVDNEELGAAADIFDALP